jgi:hypothetical protein
MLARFCQSWLVLRTRWGGWAAAVTVTLATIALVLGDVGNAAFRHWWAGHALTTDTVSGLLVVLVTVLVVDQVVRRRQLKDRARAVSAQAAIMMSQASRSVRAVSEALDGSGDRGAAGDEFRTYMTMLLVGAPVLIDARASRTFLEQAQRLGGEMGIALTAARRADGPGPQSPRLDHAIKQLRLAATPLLAELSPAERAAAAGEDGG